MWQVAWGWGWGAQSVQEADAQDLVPLRLWGVGWLDQGWAGGTQTWPPRDCSPIAQG